MRARTLGLFLGASLWAVACSDDLLPDDPGGGASDDGGGASSGGGSSGASGGGSSGSSGGVDASSDAAPPNDGAVADANDAGFDAAPSDAGDDGAAPADAGADAADAAVDAGPAPFDPFDPSIVPVFELTFDQAALDTLSVPPSEDEDINEKWVKGTFKHGNEVLAEVGVRRKGSSTFRALPNKAALKIRFNRNLKQQRWQGLTDLTLNNMTSDKTQIVERLAYHAFRAAGFPAQRANTARVFINGVDYGVYANVETPNQDFVNHAWPAGQTISLLEANGGGTWQPGVENNFEADVGADPNPHLAALFQAAAAAQPATLLADVANQLDGDTYLAYAAFEGIVGQVDGYGFGAWGSHNYYLVGDTTGKFTLLPWSLDLAMSDNNGRVDVTVPRPTYSGGTTFLMRCKASPSCWASYKTKAAAMVTVFENQNLEALARQWNAQVDAFVRADTKREGSVGAYEGETNKLYTWLRTRPAVVRAQLAAP